jgi:hypothetical protein
VKKVLIIAVCLALVLTLAFTLGASGKKPGKPEHFIYELKFKNGLDVTGTVKHCVTQGRFISSSSIDIDRPTLTLGKTFSPYNGTYVGGVDGQYLDLSEHKGEITMQFFFFYNGEKVQLNVYGDGNELVGGEVVWLSSSFTIEFVDDPAEILPTKGKPVPVWGPGNVNITVECVPQPQD